ncbi:Rieske (2Fe-2S) protein [Sciscionella marina]|uniref:Rieske (2Fe-2S) protein n=1 Tax=Sciscionella marina TaxID=508770 RepID=UPI001F097240|nr:Rieske 2Fe-2S domain-containing protein [Sciscionella marina]
MSGTRTDAWIATITLAELSRRKKIRIDVGDRAVAIFLIGERVFAFDDVCVHKGRSLSAGAVWQGHVICPGHQWKFDPETGQAEDRDECQPVHEVRVIDGVIHVGVRPRGERRTDVRAAP